MLSCNEMAAEYLFMTDKIYDPRYDTGDKVIQCGRHNDIFKLWLQWRGKVLIEIETCIVMCYHIYSYSSVEKYIIDETK